jgi:hypothetical protein
MITRAKFRVNEIKVTDEPIYNNNTGKSDTRPVAQITLSAVTDTNPENKGFFASTPAGQITLSLVNFPAAEVFKAGGEIYVDFTPA